MICIQRDRSNDRHYFAAKYLLSFSTTKRHVKYDDLEGKSDWERRCASYPYNEFDKQLNCNCVVSFMMQFRNFNNLAGDVTRIDNLSRHIAH